MRVSIYLALAGVLVLSAVLGPVARRLAPKPAACLLAAGSLAAGLGWVAGLGLLAIATVGRVAPAGAAGHWSVAVLEARDPVPVGAGLVSLAVLVLVACVVVTCAGRLAAGLVQFGRLHALAGRRRCGDLVVLDDAHPQALALPGWPGSIVVSSGMLRALGPAERQVLLAHERAHLRGWHWAFRLTTRLGAALLPTLGPLVARCDQALERWADEVAAGVVGDRSVAASAVGRAALATTAHHRSAMLAAFSGGGVAERVEALLGPCPSSRWATAALPAALGVVVLVTGIEAARDLEGLFEAARHVWMR